MSQPHELILTIDHPSGLHLRSAALFVKTAAQFESQIKITNLSRVGAPEADAKSMFGVMLIGVSQGHQIRLHADGPDADEALSTLRELVERQFEEAT